MHTTSTEAMSISSAHVEAGKPDGCSWNDMKGGTDNEFSKRGVEVINPHSEPVFAKIAKLALGEREPTQSRARVWGRQSIQADAHGRGPVEKKAVVADEEHTSFVGVRPLRMVRSISVAGSAKRDKKSAFPSPCDIPACICTR